MEDGSTLGRPQTWHTDRAQLDSKQSMTCLDDVWGMSAASTFRVVGVDGPTFAAAFMQLPSARVISLLWSHTVSVSVGFEAEQNSAAFGIAPQRFGLRALHGSDGVIHKARLVDGVLRIKQRKWHFLHKRSK